MAGPSADPDSRARTHLANERTYLAWFRTGVTLIALGLAADQFIGRAGGSHETLGTMLVAMCTVTGIAVAIGGAWRYLVARERIDMAEFRPAHASVLIATILVAAAGCVAVAFIWLDAGRS